MNYFEGLKVLELSSVLAGPMVGTFFAELGAEVIKVENKRTNGDVTRQWKLRTEAAAKEYSAYYHAANFGKESLFLDLSDEEDLQKVYELCKSSDIVIVNFKSGVAEKLRVDYNSLKQLNNMLIYAELSGFGQNSKRPAFDVVLQAETGFMFMNGEADREAVKMPVALIDILAAHQLKEGILIALLQKYKTGIGSKVTCSLFDAAIASLANQASNWLIAEHIPQRMGSLHPNIAPYGEQFKTSDEKNIVLAVGNNKQFEKLCNVLSIKNLSENDLYRTNTQRVINRTQLFNLLSAEILKYDSTELLKELEKNEVPAGLIRNMKEVFSVKKAKAMIHKQIVKDNEEVSTVKTIAFRIED